MTVSLKEFSQLEFLGSPAWQTLKIHIQGLPLSEPLYQDVATWDGAKGVVEPVCKSDTGKLCELQLPSLHLDLSGHKTLDRWVFTFSQLLGCLEIGWATCCPAGEDLAHLGQPYQVLEAMGRISPNKWRKLNSPFISISGTHPIQH